MSYLTRNKLYERTTPSKDAKKIFIFCEGARREYDYFSFFRDLSSRIDIILIKPKDNKSDPQSLGQSACEYFSQDAGKGIFSENQKDEVWFVIDTDQWNDAGKIGNLKSICDSKNKNYTSWRIAQSNPSFEIWLYFHFHNNKPQKTEVDAFRSFKEFLNVKIENGTGFDSRKHPISIDDAIKNSKANFVREGEQPGLYSTEVHTLAEIIFSFTHQQINKAKERQLTI